MNSFICPISLSIHDKIVPNNDYESLNDKVVREPQQIFSNPNQGNVKILISN